MTRTYEELVRFPTFEERYQYLKLRARVGEDTFGFDRHINQAFYTSRQWRDVRQFVIARDEGMDLGVDGYEIYDRPLIHHMNPMAVEDIVNGLESILDPRFLITTTHRTHNAIHYGDESQLPRVFTERRPGDTTLWAPTVRPRRSHA